MAKVQKIVIVNLLRPSIIKNQKRIAYSLSNLKRRIKIKKVPLKA